MDFRRSRRDFLRISGVAGLASCVPSARAVERGAKPAPAQPRARNLIFLVADGMGIGTVSLANHWMLRQRGEDSHWVRTCRDSRVRRALQDTASASSPVTDSAAAASAWGCGQRVANGSVNTGADGQQYVPLLPLARSAGKATGLVSTCRLTHATPAGFAANVPNRNLEDAIAEQYLEREIDVLLGGGRRHFLRSEASQARDLREFFRQKGYLLAEDRASLKEIAGAPRLLGLFHDSHLPYAIDRAHDPSLSEIPGLPGMFEAALRGLGRHADGFVLQVEAGRIDHAAHANDPVALLREQLEFDACIPLALDYVAAHPDTLLIITTDHGTGGCQLNGLGPGYSDSGPALDRLGGFTVSLEGLAQRFRKMDTLDPDLLVEATGIRPTDAALDLLTTAWAAEPAGRNRALFHALSPGLQDATGVGWSSHNHTAEFVDVLATGPGAELLPPFIRNNDLFGIMMRALDMEATSGDAATFGMSFPERVQPGSADGHLLPSAFSGARQVQGANG